MPEEINRVVTDHVSDILFCPTRVAVANLAREGITRGVHLTGDLMYDATLIATPIAERDSTILDDLESRGRGRYGVVDHPPRGQHRRSRDARRACWISSRRKRAKQPIVFPVHPRTRRRQ